MSVMRVLGTQEVAIMTRRREDVRRKEIHAWGIKRKDVDINQLALAYYLLARRRIEQKRQAGQLSSDGSDREAA